MISSISLATIRSLKPLVNPLRTLACIMLSFSARDALGQVTPTGAYSTSIPIETPSFHAITPRLSIEYNSQSGNSMLGVGWHLRGISEIRATSATGGTPEGTSTDKFRLDGIELIPCANAPSGSAVANSPSCKYALPAPLVAYTSRIESFQRIAFEPNAPGGQWFTWNKDGTKRTYAPSVGSTQWNISEVLDVHGNRVTYGYTNLGVGASPDYLKQVRYNQNHIEFYWEPRTDVIGLSAGAGEVFLNRRLRSIDIQVESKRLRAYAFTYTISPGTKRSTLSRIAEYGTNATVDPDGNVSGPTLPPAIMVYADKLGPADWKPVASLPTILPALAATPQLFNQYQYDPEIADLGVDYSFLTGDFDGDGRTDGLILSVMEDPAVATSLATIVSPQNAKLVAHVRLASQIWVKSEVPFEASAHWGDIATPPSDGREKLVKAWVADVNGDGLDDLILLAWKLENNQSYNGRLQLMLNTALSKGDGTFGLGQPQFAPMPWITSVVWGSRNTFPEFSPVCLPGDFDGNGRADFACMFQDLASNHLLGVAYSNSSGGFSSGGPPIQVAQNMGVETLRLAAGDINNDGQTDLYVLDLNSADATACVNQSTCTIKYELLTLLSRGVGFDIQRTATPWTRIGFRKTVQGSLATADLNGDGHADALFLTGASVSARFQTLKRIGTAIRDDDGSYRFAEVILPPALTDSVHYSLGDTNGDGRTDLMIAKPIGPQGGINCSSAAFPRAVLTVVTTNKDGSFNFPARWDDCSVSKEVTDQWAQWTRSREISREIMMLHAGDTNGDGYADFILPAIHGSGSGQLLLAVYDRVAQPGNNAPRRWIGADLNGDGSTDFISIAHETNDSWAMTLIARPNGSYKATLFQLGSFFSPFPNSFQNPSMRSWRIMDVNADGKADIVHVQCAFPFATRACKLEVQSFLSRGDGTFTREPVSLAAAVPNADGAALAGLRIADVDRDGKTDMLQTLVLTDPATGARHLAVRTLLSDGSGWQQQPVQPINVSGAPATPTFISLMSNLLAWHLGDFDGDGRADLLHIVSNSNGAQLTVASFHDGGWEARSSGITHPSVAGGWLGYKGLNNVVRWQVTDVNGDGLSDVVRLIRGDLTFAVHSLESLGAQGWVNRVDPVVLPSGGTAEQSFGAHDWYNIDVDGDGLADVVYFASPPGNALTATVLYASGTGYGRVEQRRITNPSPRFEPRPTQEFGDVKGTGNMSLLYVDQVSTNATVRSVQLGQVGDLLVQHGSGGASTDVTYTFAGRFIDANASDSCALPLGKILRVVESTATGDGRLANKDRTTYGYGCPRWSHYHRTLLGWEEGVAFRAKAVNRPAFAVRTTYRHSDECLTAIQLQSITNSAGNFVGPRSIVAYLPHGLSPPFQCLVNYTQRVTHGSGRDASRPAVNLNTSFRYDEFGNVVAVVENGFNGLARATLRTFKYSAQPYVVDVLANEQLHDGLDASATLLRAEIFCYDGDQSFTCSAAPTKGLRTALIDIWEQGTRITKYQYDAVGNLASIMDANNHGTAYFFDPVQRTFPVAVVNALGETVIDVQWDRTLGEATQITGMNGEKLTFEYDEFGRLTKTISPTGGTANRRYELWGDPKQQRIVETLLDGSVDGLWTRQYFDGLGRLYRLESKADEPTAILGQRFVYSDASRYPYRTSRSSRWSPSGPYRARAYTTYAYDEAGRVVQLTRPGGATVRSNVEASRNRLLTTVIDENGWRAQSYHDAFERLVEVRSFDGSQIIATQYEYDGAGQIRKVVDPNGNYTVYQWDLLGRNTRIADPDFGVRANTYDLVGNLTSMTDARNKVITFRYDALNRMTAKIYPTGQQVQWNYSEATSQNGRGRLTSYNDLTSAGCGTDPSGLINYDANGKPIAVTRCIQGTRANFGFKYDPLGRLKDVTYPDGEVVNYEYGAAGLLAKLQGIVDIQQRDADGRPTRMVYGNGVIRRLTYDANSDWLERQTDRLGSKSIFSATYTYEPNGLVKTARSLSNQTNLTIQYDAVRRITGLSGSQTQSWSYDRSGNILFNSALGYYTYPVGPVTCTTPGAAPGQCKQPHAPQSAGGFSLRYDDNGLLSMMTNNNTGQIRSIDWNFDMLPAVVLDFDGKQTNLEYDAFGNRAVETRGQEVVVYFGPFARTSSSTGSTNTYIVGDRMIASRTGGTRIWMHYDRNDAVRAVTDANGLVLGRMNYGPFGEVRFAPGHGSPVAKFAGVDIDDGTGLQYMGARFYDPVLNRFISPDQIVPDALNTQATNRYSYDYNNPMSYFDPSGHQPIEITSSYYGTPTPASGFDFSVHGYSAMPGTGLTGAGNVSLSSASAFSLETGPQAGRPQDVGEFLERPWDQQLHLIHQDANPSLNVTINGSMTYGGLLNLESDNMQAMTWGAFQAVTTGLLFVGRAGPTLAPATRVSSGGTTTQFAPWAQRGAENDAKWAQLSAMDRIYSDIGNKALPGGPGTLLGEPGTGIFAQYEHILDPVARGQAIADDYGLLHALFRIYPREILQVWSTGPTSSARMAGGLMTRILSELPARGSLAWYLHLIAEQEQRKEDKLMSPVRPSPFQ